MKRGIIAAIRLIKTLKGEEHMTYQTKDYKNYLGKIVEFKQLGWVQTHLHLMEKPNFWSILEYGEDRGAQDRSAHETRTSRMFRWLLDANETHHLGNVFAHKLIELIGGNYEYYPGRNEAIQATAEEQHIDVLYKDISKKIMLAIEVKQYAEEGISNGISQLDRYEDFVRQFISSQDDDITPYYIYLTPLKEKPSNPNWLPVSYEEFIDIIDQVHVEYMASSRDMYIEDTKKIISDFKDDLQRSVDLLEKDQNQITLTKAEEELTKKLAHEIQHETDARHMNKLMKINEDKDLPLKDLILIINDTLSVQNHTQNTGVQILMRKIYNYFSENRKLETAPGQIVPYKVNATLEPLKREMIEGFDLPCKEIALTSQKGQGLFIYHQDNKHRFYLSGDTYGNFPNHGFQLLRHGEEKGKVTSSPTINNERFLVDYELILEDKIKTKAGKVIRLEQLIDDYIMVELKQLSNHVPEPIS